MNWLPKCILEFIEQRADVTKSTMLCERLPGAGRDIAA